MKRVCKDIDITDVDFILQAIKTCVGNKKSTRRDVVKLKKEYPDLRVLAEELSSEIKNKNLILKPIWYSDRYESGCGKIRHIAIQDIKQQIYDYIAVIALAPVFKRIGYHQCSSIPKRGQSYCLRLLKRQVRKSKYFYKADVKKYFQSVDKKRLISVLNKRVKNDDLMWLVESLLDTFEDGLAIGSYLSQNLANLYMSILYHKLFEDCYYIRHSKQGNQKKKCVDCAIFYMDDFVVFTNNRKYLKVIDQCVKDTLAEMGLGLKQKPQFGETAKDVIDMVGFKIYKDHVAIRRNNFIRARRAFMRFNRKPKSVKLAGRVISYWSFFKWSDSWRIIRRLRLKMILKKARSLVSENCKIRLSTAACIV